MLFIGVLYFLWDAMLRLIPNRMIPERLQEHTKDGLGLSGKKDLIMNT